MQRLRRFNNETRTQTERGAKTYVLLLWILFPSLVSCTFQPRVHSAGQHPSTLRWAIGTAPETLDWTLCATRQCLNQSALTMEGLTGLTTSDREIQAVPALAAEWSAPSPTEFIFKIKPNILWSDGTPLRSRHFLAAWAKLLSPKAHATFASLLFTITNARAYSEGKVPFAEVGVKAPDDQTLVIRLNSPDPIFPLKLSHPATWPVSDKISGGGHSVLGPFMLQKFTPGNFWRYIRNPSYYGSPAALQAIEVRWVESSATRIDLFMNGETDLVDELPEPVLSSVEQVPGFFSQSTNRLLAIVFNTSKRMFSTSEQRQWLTSSISPEETARLVGRNDTPVQHLFPGGTQSLPGWTPNLSPTTPKSLFAPFTNDGSLSKVKNAILGHGANRMTLSWNRNSISPEVAENIQAQLQKNIDLRLDLVPLGSPLREDQIEPDNSALTLVNLSTSPLSPSGPFELFSSSNPRNPARWKNRMFDAMLAQAIQATSLSDWSEKLNEADELIVAREGVVFPLLIRSRNGLRRPQMKNLNQNPIEIWDFRDTTM
jgi:oligopeptide transport system substrate-binding protein